MDLLECPVCLETYDDPQLLPSCGHTFCRHCVDRLRGLAVGPAWPPKCPTCRSPFRPGDPRPNHALRQLLAERPRTPRAHSDRAVAAFASDAAPTGGLRRGLTRELNEIGAKPDASKVRRLEGLGVPFGLARLLEEEDRQIGRRIFLLDNSGSTQAYDGHHYQAMPDGTWRSMPCSRWEEIKHMALEQAQWNQAMGTPCEFVLLNPGPEPLQEGRDYVRMDGASGPAAVDALRRMLEGGGPRGVTPIADRLQEIHQRVSGQQAELARNGQRVVLVIATDGLPTSAGSGQSTSQDKQRMVQALKRLGAELSVFIVIRLTTDEDSVVDYYNEVDEELELPLEVLDDIESEAREIRGKGNGWLAYSPLLHKIREGGTFVKLFDLLDERCFTPTEVSLMAQLLLRREGQAPMPRSADDFCDALEDAVDEAPLVYDPLRRTMGPPIHVGEVRWALFPLAARLAGAARAAVANIGLLLAGPGGSCMAGPAGNLEQHNLVF